MKQIQIVQQLAPGGIETMALDLKRFSSDPEQTLIISLEGTTSSLVKAWPRLQPLASNIIGLDKPPGISFKTLGQLRKILRRFKPDLVHTHHIGPLLYGGMAARLAGCKTLIHTEHDAWHLRAPKRRLIASSAVRWLRPLLVADAQMVSDEVTRQLGIKPKMVIKNGIDTQKFTLGDQAKARQVLGLPKDAFIVGCAARLIAVKGHRVLLESMQSMPPTVQLALAGHGELADELRQYADQLGLSPRVHWLGNVENMPSFYQALDVACLASYQEGFPLSLLEAQACGIPVVASNTGGVNETLCPHNSHLVQSGDAAQLASVLMECIAQSCGERRHSVAWAVRDFVTRNNDVREMVKHYQALAWGNG